MTPEQEKERKLAEIARRYGFEKRDAENAAAGPERTGSGEPAPSGPPKRNPTRPENEVMLNLMILRNGILKYGPGIRDRCREAGKWVWRDLRLVLRLIEKIQDKLLDTMPERRLEYYRAYMKYGRYVMEIQQPVKLARHMIITDVHLGAICDAAITGECALCAREGKDVERCALREAMLEVAPPQRLFDGENRFDECEYRKVAQQMLLGESIEI